MKFSYAIQKYSKDMPVKRYIAAREACREAGLQSGEVEALNALIRRLQELSGKPIVIGV